MKEDYHIRFNKKLGISGAPWVHKWMDAYAATEGGNHRKYRHNLETVKTVLAVLPYPHNVLAAKEILAHLILDKLEEMMFKTENQVMGVSLKG